MGLYPLPGGQDELPDAPRFPFVICTTRERFKKIIAALDNAFFQEEDFAILIDVLDAWRFAEDPHNSPCLPAAPVGETCRDYTPDSYIITWNPTDPFQTPNLTPSGYDAPAWYMIQAGSTTVPGAQPGDVFTDPTRLIGDSWLDQLTWTARLPGIISSGLPRFKIHFEGSGKAQLHLLKVPFGGLAYVTLDGSPLGSLVNLSTVSLADLDSILTAINALLPDAIEGSLVSAEIIEIPVNSPGQHYIDVTMIPAIIPPALGFGGGLRKVTLCGESMQGVPNLMPQFRITNGQLEWRPTHDSTAWENLGQVVGADGQPGADGQNAPIPLIAADTTNGEYKLLFDMNADGTPELTTPNLKGQPGADGQPGTPGAAAPVPVVSLDTANGEYKVLFDMNADGTPELTTPNLKGEPGQNGQPGTPGAPGQNAPIPIFAWQGTTLKIDANADGVFDYTSPDLKGAQGAPGNCECNTPADTTTPSLENACAGVLGLVSWIIERYDNSLARAENAFAQGELVLDAVVGIAELLSAGTLELFPLDEIENFYYDLTAQQLGSMRIQLADSAFVEDLQKKLYCRIANADPQQLDQTIYDAWVGDIAALNHFTAEKLALHIEKFLSWATVSQRYYIYALETSSFCSLWSDCLPPAWEHTFDFATGTHGWIVDHHQSFQNTNGGSYDGSKFIHGDSSNPGYYDRAVFISKTFARTEITKVVLYGDYQPGIGDYGVAFVLIENGVVRDIGAFGVSPGAVVAQYIFDRHLDKIRVGMTPHGTTSPWQGSASITKVIVYGKGDNPFS